MKLIMRNILFIGLFLFVAHCNFNRNPKLNFSLPLPSSNSSVSTTKSYPFVGATILESGGSTDIFEGVTKDSYTIVLNSVPKDSVIISVSFDNTQITVNDLTTSPISISFTTANWNIPQTVYVTAIYDNTTEGNHKSSILHSTTDETGIVTIGTVIANITDNSGSRLTNSLQSGTVLLGTSPLNISLSIAVNASKSYVYCNSRLNGSALSRAVTCQIADDGLSVIIKSGSASATTVVNWYVIEFSKGAFVQRGSNSLLSTQSLNTITLSTAIDLSRTFIIAYSRTTNGNNNNDEQRTLRYRMLSSTSFEVLRNETGINVDYEWQVIQLDGAKVQSGIASIANGSTSNSATLNNLMLNNSFIILNYTGGTGVNGAETDYYVQGSFLSSTQIGFNRTGSADTVDLSWFAIEMIDGTTVQSGIASVSANSAFIDVSLNAVDSNKTMIVFANQVETGDSLVTTQDSGTFSATFLNSSIIRFERDKSEVNVAKISWFAVQFQ
ncbi:MAG TPA: hypothetical protein PLX69_16280 [Leptospiraceae bacterium]|nr:hypothetical protein [Leptospiraceae bacterium]